MPAPGPDAPLRLPPRCNRCQANPVAWSSPRVDFCYQCLPGGPFPAPPCRWCGTAKNYFSQGLCIVCHPRSPQRPGACKGCMAWGVYPGYNWTCWPCRWWRTHYPEGMCDFCGRLARIGNSGACRLCVEQAQMIQEAGRALDYAGANRHSQQLFLANMLFKRRVTPRLVPAPGLRPGPRARKARKAKVRTGTEPWKSRYKNQLPYPAGTGFDDEASVQLTLFDLAPDPEAVRRRVLIEDSDLTRFCAAIVDEHAERYGWSVRQRNDVTRSLRLLQTLREAPTAKIRASDVMQLPRYDGNIISTIDVLADAELLIEDRPSRVEVYFAAKAASLPPQMREHLELWLQVMLDGSRLAPRQVPRDPQTVRVQIMGLVTVVNTWADAGYQSFAQVTRSDIEDALTPLAPGRRHAAELALRSLFKTLQGRRLIFANPMRGMKHTPLAGTIPLALDPAAIRAELNHPDPVVALAVALVAFHALTGKQLRALMLTDIIDGRLTIGEREIPLAAPVRTRLAAWLDHRARRWPGCINPHLLVSKRTAPRLVPVGHSFPWRGITLRPQALREDRILHEIHATGGDIRRICDLFGLGVEGATRYLQTVEHPDLTIEGGRVHGSRTAAPKAADETDRSGESAGTMSHMAQTIDASIRDRVARHYQRCVDVLRARDLDGFLDWLGPEGTFSDADGAIVRFADTRPFWEWRFNNVLAVRRCEIHVEDVSYTDDGLLVVDFHERSGLTVRGFDDTPVERDADLHNRNLWEISDDRLTARGGIELVTRRTIDGQPLTDEIDPWGFGAWARYKEDR